MRHHDVTFIIEVDARLVPSWDLFTQVVRWDIEEQLDGARFEIMEAQQSWDTPSLSLIPLSETARTNVDWPPIIDMIRQYMFKQRPTKLITYNEARTKAKEPRFIYDNRMMDDPPRNFPKGEYKATTDPVMGIRI